MLKVAVCDDNAGELDRVVNLVRDYGDFDISAYTSSKKLAQAISCGAAFDLYLLDIVMPKPDGIELALFIREKDEDAVIIYLTSHDRRALEAFRVRASQYLVKPVQGEVLHRELDAALSTVKTKSSHTFLLKTKTGAEAIPFHQIVYCELCGRTLRCVTADGAEHRSVTLRASFDEAVAQLLADSRFIRPHTSFVANLEHVRRMQGNALAMKTGTQIPITRGMAGEVKARFLQYFFGGESEC